MSYHDQEFAESQLAAYALGALDLEESLLVEQLLASSPAYQEELRQLRETVALLPYAAPVVSPPERVRERLFARIASSQDGERSVVVPPLPPAPEPRWRMRMLVAVLAVLLLSLGVFSIVLNSAVARLDTTNRELLLALGSLQQTVDATQTRQAALAEQLVASERKLDELDAALGASEQRIAQLTTQLAQNEYVIAFVSGQDVATRDLNPLDAELATRGAMYMYPGQLRAVVLFSELPPLRPGEVYQFWLADEAVQVAAGTFGVGEGGVGQLIIQAPRRVDAFQQVMVTVEPLGGSATPSANVLLAGAL